MDLDLPRALVGMGFFLVAAAMDWRRRVVKDGVWVALGTVALGFGAVDLLRAGAPGYLHLMFASTAILYFGVFFGEPMWTETGFRPRPLRSGLYLLSPVLVFFVWSSSARDLAALGSFYRLLTMPAMVVVAHGLYEFNLLRGGADAKALMALALLFPGIYPHLGSFPLLAPAPLAEPVLAVAFPFAFVVLVNGALLFLVVPLWFLAYNAARGHAKLPRALFGYRVPLDAVPKFAWLMDRLEDGRHVTAYLPRRQEDREEQVRQLRAHGFQDVWVTPQLPFIAAMFAGYVLAIVVGNPLLGAFGGLGR